MEPYDISAQALVTEGNFLCYGCRKEISLERFCRGAVSRDYRVAIAFCRACVGFEDKEGSHVEKRD